MTPGFLQALQQHSWKGNIRELRNVIERAVILTETDLLEAAILPLDFQWAQQKGDAASLSLAEMEKQHIVKVLAFTKGNKTKAAELMEIGLTTLYNKIKEYNIHT